jgi:hypothetical protein
MEESLLEWVIGTTNAATADDGPFQTVRTNAQATASAWLPTYSSSSSSFASNPAAALMTATAAADTARTDATTATSATTANVAHFATGNISSSSSSSMADNAYHNHQGLSWRNVAIGQR